MTERVASPTSTAQSKRLAAVMRLGRSEPIALRRVLITVCVVARLPEFSSTMARSPGASKTDILQNVEM